ncbi:NUDIX domain-containing protein [uncultured Psychroserpens sp.]|uniref:NUDIX hydrolase n=1 Tax=uncultured Psychroserpens sp. TaxID=255436 RepID=UPI0026131226|nr:NUDIX domain-containing protein [uncultured Psychroserpens sp.]
MDELIDIVDENGNATGKSALKSEIHSKGLFHHTAHLWCYTSKGHILLQQRAATKSIAPLLWDVSVAGHVDAGETIAKAIIREAKEEIGLDLFEHQLIKIGVFKCFQTYENGIIDNEFHNTFISKIDVAIKQLILQENEVEAVKYVTISEFETLLQKSEINNHFIASNSNYYHFVLNAIKKQIQQ